MSEIDLARLLVAKATLLLEMLEKPAEPQPPPKPQVTRPDYESNGGWAIGPQHKRTQPLALVVLHHEGSSKVNGSSALAIHRYQREVNRWAAVGYHFLIERDGTIHEGRDTNTIGAHAKDHNTNSLGICLIGNLELAPPTREQTNSLSALLEWLLWEFKLTPAAVVGHGEINNTTCPGRYLNVASIRAQLEG